MNSARRLQHVGHEFADVVAKQGRCRLTVLLRVRLATPCRVLYSLWTFNKSWTKESLEEEAVVESVVESVVSSVEAVELSVVTSITVELSTVVERTFAKKAAKSLEEAKPWNTPLKLIIPYIYVLLITAKRYLQN